MSRTPTQSKAVVALVLAAVITPLAGPSFGTVNGSFDLPVPSNDTGGGWETWNIGSTGGWRADSGCPGAMFALAGIDSGGAVPTIRQLQSGWPAASHYGVVYFCACDSSCLVVPLVVNIHGSTAAMVYGHAIGVWDSTSLAIQAPAEPFYITLQTSTGARYLLDNVQRRDPKIDDVAVRASRPGKCLAQQPLWALFAVTLNGRAIMPCGSLRTLANRGALLIAVSRRARPCIRARSGSVSAAWECTRTGERP